MQRFISFVLAALFAFNTAYAVQGYSRSIGTYSGVVSSGTSVNIDPSNQDCPYDATNNERINVITSSGSCFINPPTNPADGTSFSAYDISGFASENPIVLDFATSFNGTTQEYRITEPFGYATFVYDGTAETWRIDKESRSRATPYTGEGDPTRAPTYLGEKYIDTNTTCPRTFEAACTTGTDCWVITSGQCGGWKSFFVPAETISLGTTNWCDQNATEGTVVCDPTAVTSEFVIFQTQMPADWDVLTNVKVSPHYSRTTSASGTIEWDVEYRHLDRNALEPSAWETVTETGLENNLTDNNVAGQQLVDNFGEADFGTSNYRQRTRWRVTLDNASTYAADVTLWGVEFHYQSDNTLGDTEYVKGDGGFTPPPPTPTSNLVLQLKASVGVSDTGGTVTQWADVLSGNGHTLDTVAGDPQLTTDTSLNSRPVIVCDGTDDHIIDSAGASGLPSGNGARTVVVVNKWGTSDTFTPTFAWGDNTANDNYWHAIDGQNPSQLGVEDGNTFWPSSGTSYAPEGEPWFIHASIYDGAGTLNNYRNEIEIHEQTGLTLTTQNGIISVCTGTNLAKDANVSIAEIRVYDTNLSISEYNTLVSQLKTEYGITNTGGEPDPGGTTETPPGTFSYMIDPKGYQNGTNVPDFAADGLTYTPMVYNRDVLATTKSQIVPAANDAKMITMVNEYDGYSLTRLIQDIEVWKIGQFCTSSISCDRTVNVLKHIEYIDNVRTAWAAENISSIPFVGWYGELPIRNFFAAIKAPTDPKYLEWQRMNDEVGGTFTGTHGGSNNASVLTIASADRQFIKAWGGAAIDLTASDNANVSGYTIENVTDGSSCTVTANTATTVTCTLSGGTDNDWDTGDQYSMEVGVITNIDFLMPSLYTFYGDTDNEPTTTPSDCGCGGDEEGAWETYARAMVSEARRLAVGRAVHCVLWPRYHDSNQQGLSSQFINQTFFNNQLTVVREICDGMIIWDPAGDANYNPNGMDWNNGVAGAANDFPYYPTLKAFVTANP